MRAPMVGGVSHRARAKFISWERAHSRSRLLNATTTRIPTPSSAALRQTASVSVPSTFTGAFPYNSASNLAEDWDDLQGPHPTQQSRYSDPRKLPEALLPENVAISKSLKGERDLKIH